MLYATKCLGWLRFCKDDYHRYIKFVSLNIFLLFLNNVAALITTYSVLNRFGAKLIRC
jgi:hypothetical protein